jgi:AraC family transcriptional regulator
MAAQRQVNISNFGNDYGKLFYLKNVPSLLLESEKRPQMAVTRLWCPNGLPEPTAPVKPERGFTINVHLQQPVCKRWGTWVDGKFCPIKHWELGSIGIYDLEADPIALRESAFDSVHFNLPRRTLDAFAAENGLGTIETLTFTQARKDDVLFRLTKFILPWLGDGIRMSDLMFDYYALMFCSHMASTYGNIRMFPSKHVGGLAPWQIRRVADLIEDHLDGELRLAMLARQCSLSVSHFSRSFKQSFGVPVHRYVVERRIERAKTLMRRSAISLTEIALSSGFADQASFSRSFGGFVGTSPRRWLNEYRSSSSFDFEPDETTSPEE